MLGGSNGERGLSGSWELMVQWLGSCTPEYLVHNGAQSRVTVSHSQARHLTLSIPLSAQECKWYWPICEGNLTIAGSHLQWTSIPSMPLSSQECTMQLCIFRMPLLKLNFKYYLRCFKTGMTYENNMKRKEFYCT